MITRYRATIGGVHLDQVHPAIYIKDIQEDGAAISISVNQRPEMNGSHLSIKKRSSMTVSIVFEVHEYDISRRQDVLDSIMAWCDGGEYLTVNYRIGKRLKVSCTGYPSGVSSMEWTQELKVQFTAYEVPFWESEFVHSGEIVRSGNTYSTTVNVGGTNETPLEVTVKNTGSAAIQACTVTAGVNGGNSRTIALNGISVNPGETLTIGHDESDRLQLYTDNASVYPQLVATSDDDISLMNGQNFITVSVNADAEVRYAYRERWK